MLIKLKDTGDYFDTGKVKIKIIVPSAVRFFVTIKLCIFSLETICLFNICKGQCSTIIKIVK